MGRYDYAELRAADLADLADWLFEYDPGAWNGECWNIDNGRELWPIYSETAPDEYEITGYEIR